MLGVPYDNYKNIPTKPYLIKQASIADTFPEEGTETQISRI